MKTLKNLLKIVPLLACAYAGSAQALTINFTYDPAMDARALAGFQTAANRWQSVLHDNVQVNLNIAFAALAPNVLGSTSSRQGTLSYAGFRQALIRDAKTSTDFQAIANLPAGPCLSVMMNGTNVNPAGAGSAATFVDNDCDANNRAVTATWANFRALGLIPDSDKGSDGSISFSTGFASIFDFDPTDGIGAGLIDFTGVAAHEIGHALGFISGVDILDQVYTRTDLDDSAFTLVAPADLYRCSPASKAAGADIDWSADARDKFFSLDNCTTTLSIFSNGRANGDGQQASHWKDNRGIGLLDPTAGRGELLAISQMDLMMFDAIGWDVPEPASIALFALGAAGLAGARRRKQKQA
ncbi:NF038122 family metalloprotease [Massilia sp. IC2-477]|uniref:NF038122 family metalloprotease n=1 Tax=unclassified Massilia TaxID=2609279 RepID=UPI001D1125E6|nr:MULTISPECIES: NF038122 family metalloprotease [unclassified Massilia]MCC2957918.1 NF038122 family metalloprotease [Massilia sp. IC2-477]MCC2974881.1 NF038122 family metalloprotease [Massilia sp. IC2-476]